MHGSTQEIDGLGWGGRGSVTLFAIPASAAGTGTVSPNPVSVTGGQTSAAVTVAWSGLQNPGHTLFITQCKKIESDPTFNFAQDCSNLSEVPINASANPGGAANSTFNLFRGENPDGDSGWGCFAEGDTIPDGVTPFTTCFVRVAEDAESNTSTDFSIPFTFAATTGGDLPRDLHRSAAAHHRRRRAHRRVVPPASSPHRCGDLTDQRTRTGDMT